MSRLSGRIAPTGGATCRVLNYNDPNLGLVPTLTGGISLPPKTKIPPDLHSHRQAHYLATPSTRRIAMGMRTGESHPCQTRKKGSARGDRPGRLPVSVTEQKQHKNVCHATLRRLSHRHKLSPHLNHLHGAGKGILHGGSKEC